MYDITREQQLTGYNYYNGGSGGSGEWAKATTSLLALAVVALGAARTLEMAALGAGAALLEIVVRLEIRAATVTTRTVLAVPVEAQLVAT